MSQSSISCILWTHFSSSLSASLDFSVFSVLWHARARRKMKWKCVESECFSLILSDMQETKRACGLNRGSQIAVSVCVCVYTCVWSECWLSPFTVSEPPCRLWKLNGMKNSSVGRIKGIKIFFHQRSSRLMSMSSLLHYVVCVEKVAAKVDGLKTQVR